MLCFRILSHNSCLISVHTGLEVVLYQQPAEPVQVQSQGRCQGRLLLERLFQGHLLHKGQSPQEPQGRGHPVHPGQVHLVHQGQSHPVLQGQGHLALQGQSRLALQGQGHQGHGRELPEVQNLGHDPDQAAGHSQGHRQAVQGQEVDLTEVGQDHQEVGRAQEVGQGQRAGHAAGPGVDLNLQVGL